MNAICFCPMFERCSIDKRNDFYMVFHKERNPFFYCLDQILVHLPAVLNGKKSSYWSIGGQRYSNNRNNLFSYLHWVQEHINFSSRQQNPNGKQESCRQPGTSWKHCKPEMMNNKNGIKKATMINCYGNCSTSRASSQPPRVEILSTMPVVKWSEKPSSCIAKRKNDPWKRKEGSGTLWG